VGSRRVGKSAGSEKGRATVPFLLLKYGSALLGYGERMVMPASTQFILKQLEPFAQCEPHIWDLVVQEVESHGLNQISKSSMIELKVAKAGWERMEKARYASRSEASRFAAEQRWKGHAKKEPSSGMRKATVAERKQLGVPPAWTDVEIADSPKGVNGLLFRGIDAKGRVQSKYTEEHSAKRSKLKFKRILELETHLGKLDATLEKGVKSGDEHAVCLSIIRQGGCRPGSDNETLGTVKAFGATTLEARHVKVAGDVVKLDFVGKSGKQNQIEIKDKNLASAMRTLLKGKGKSDKVFASVDAPSLLEYQRTILPKKFLLKDLRTSLGTKTALLAIKKMAVPKTKTAYKKAKSEIGKIVSEKLGNTPAIALQSYINPMVFGVWEGVSE
jgi:DNA topoisomerase-1